MADLDDMLSMVAAERGVSYLGSNTQPTETQAVGWINDAIRETVRNLCPRRLDNGQWTPGRRDKLVKLTEKEVSSTQPNGAKEFYELPAIAPGICFYASIRLSPNSATEANQVRARETNMREIQDRSSGTYTVPVTAPIFAWAEGGIIYRPSTASGVGSSVSFYYVKLPALLVQAGAEDFPLDDDLMPVVMEYVYGQLWASNQLNAQLASLHFGNYLNMIQDLLISSPEIVSRET